MKLRDYIELKKNDEIEVFDEVVDVLPFYVCGGHAFEDNIDEKDLYNLENIIFDLEVKHLHDNTCSINVYNLVKEHWSKLYNHYTDLCYENVKDDDNLICDCVEDVFNTMSRGVYGVAEMLVNAINGTERETNIIETDISKECVFDRIAKIYDVIEQDACISNDCKNYLLDELAALQIHFK